MTHPIVALQSALMNALLTDTELVTALGGSAIFDAPPKGQQPPYVAIIRHDVLPRDGDATPGHDHRLLLHCWHPEASRKSVLTLVDRIVALALNSDLSGNGLIVTHAQHDRTDTAIDLKTGWARGAIALRFYSEPSV